MGNPYMQSEIDLYDENYDSICEVYDRYGYITEHFNHVRQVRKKKSSKGKHVNKQHKSKIKQVILDENNKDNKQKKRRLTENIVRNTPKMKNVQLNKEYNKLDIILDHLERRRENRETALAKKGLKRKVPTKKPVINNIDNHILTSTTTPTNSIKDTGVAEFLIDIQFRDISPEDYDFLLQLDECVQKKVVSKGSINNLPIPNSIDPDSICVICFDVITNKMLALMLPKCKHIFHAQCIKTWLGEISDKCPIDNVIV